MSHLFHSILLEKFLGDATRSGAYADSDQEKLELHDSETDKNVMTHA